MGKNHDIARKSEEIGDAKCRVIKPCSSFEVTVHPIPAKYWLMIMKQIEGVFDENVPV